MEENIKGSFELLREFYASGVTKDINYRKRYLKKLYESIVRHEKDIADALWSDLHKSPEETYISETGIVLAEIRSQLNNIGKWARRRRYATPLFLQPSLSRTIYEPKGVVLVIAPWNYPFQLALDPLVGAIAAGNCVALKPSTSSAATCRVVKVILEEVFPAGYVTVFDGNHAQTADLLACRFDHIFFTGGVSFGKTVMQAAAQNLIPVTLELGGKSPCVVSKEADVAIAARRIVWGKLMNAGQTCIAPDYIMVHRDVKKELIDALIANIEKMYGKDIKNNPDYPRIISDKAFARLDGYLNEAINVVYGGGRDAGEKFIAPTIVDSPAVDSLLMQEEIFGPIFPVLPFDSEDDVVAFINSREKPLALYYFGRKKDGMYFLSQATSGGACINDTIVHIANPRIPFGGVGHSGMGRYHGLNSFETFSNARGTIISSSKLDFALRYPPYRKYFKLLKKIL